MHQYNQYIHIKSLYSKYIINLECIYYLCKAIILALSCLYVPYILTLQLFYVIIGTALNKQYEQKEFII